MQVVLLYLVRALWLRLRRGMVWWRRVGVGVEVWLVELMDLLCILIG